MSQNKDNLTTFEYNGYSFEFDVRDAEDSKKYEDAIENLGKAEENFPKTGKSSDMIIAHCTALKKFFDDCLGTGAGDKVCTKKSNLSVCYKAYDDFLAFVRKQSADISDTLSSFSKRAKNRQQRRQAVKTAAKQAKATPAKK